MQSSSTLPPKRWRFRSKKSGANEFGPPVLDSAETAQHIAWASPDELSSQLLFGDASRSPHLLEPLSMRPFSLVISLLLLTTAILGCGEMPTPESSGTSKKKSSTAKPAVKLPEVTQASFASVSEAMAEAERLASSTEATAGQDRMKVEQWLELQGSKIADELIARLGDSSQGLTSRMTACRVLSRLGPVAKPALLQAADGDNAQLKIKAIECLGRVKPSDAEIVKKLIATLDSSDFAQRKAALAALAYVGPAAKDAIPKLTALLNDQKEDETIRGAAKKALKEVDPRKGLMNAY
nr:HEAT repeat domain-containing protein [Pirellula staleyi]